ncbi:MAG: DUF6010 family protein [Ferruginibacter sp.]
MNATIIGLSSGILVIVIIGLLKMLDKATIYGLILSGIGFLYVGFTWSDIPLLIITSVQAIFFLVIAYYGIIKNLYYLAAGYFLHGLWDLAFDYFHQSNLIPPHYDMFCLSIDFTIGFYLALLQYRMTNKIVIL